MSWATLWRMLLACALALGTIGPATAADDDPGDPARQVLVMLPIVSGHFRPDGAYSGAYTDSAGRTARRRVAAVLAREYGLTMRSDWPMPLLGIDCYVMEASSAVAARSVATALSLDSRVAWAEAMNVYAPRGHDDPLFAMQPSTRLWHLDELHRVGMGHNVRIAEIDSGVEAAHPDLAGQLLFSQSFTEGNPNAAERHGTAVAGIIVARADNRIGIVGVAPEARLMALRACWQRSQDSTLCTSLTLALALQAAIDHSAQIINMSLSGPPDRLLGKLLDVAQERGIVIVAAADPGLASGGFPAQHPGVLAVGETPQAATAGLTVLAPGRDIPTTLPGGGWGVVSGASYAAAHVSGLVALVLELRARPGNRDVSIKDALLVLEPTGQIDACQTLQRASHGCVCNCPASLPARSAMRE